MVCGIKSLKINITGQVQGVGFRPFIYRLAKQFNLRGWVKNRSGEVMVLVQGQDHHLEAFQQSVLHQHPPLAIPVIESVEAVNAAALTEFIIKKSTASKHAQRHIPADFFTCNDCLNEIKNPQQRRYRYPFINCTQCGPRYTIIGDLPYDRPNTSMADFPLCDACYKEYSDTLDRRFHAQPLACAQCGPQLSFLTATTKITGNEVSLTAAVKSLKQGKILAVKGIGGYHLMCDATNEQAVQRLRERKHRPDKPLAVMFSASGENDLEQLEHYCTASAIESEIVASAQRPIVLVQAKKDRLAKAIYPGLDEVGAMLAYSPLHYLILKDLALPLVATSGNLSGEPVLTDNQQAETRLHNIADAFLQHNRPILRPADDSVVRIISQQPRLFRIGRGMAPLEINLPYTVEKPLLAVGGQMKNTIALAWENRVVISPHIGELDSKRSIEVFSRVINDLCQLYQVQPEHIICDAHPGYYSSRYAKKFAHEHNITMSKVQHHRAHASILCGEFDKGTANKPWLVFTWDGTGLGDDQTIWGGEGFYGQAGNWQRLCSIKPFYLQGGDRAAREPWRSACALLWEKDLIYQSESAQTDRDSLAFKAWKKRLNSIASSSMGRLFDAASALLGMGETSSFEGQGPMLLEACLSDSTCRQVNSSQLTDSADKSALPLYDNKALIIADWSELLPILMNDNHSRVQRALCFHQKIAETLIAQAKKVRSLKGEFCLGLSGGVFQNKYLTEYLLKRLEEEKFQAFLPEKVPYNDAGLAFGQIIEGIHNECK
ncbi:MAG: carbamoyltransferase HypF [Gammaproteobacteria bacterium]|nr:carbamoyltransferase HypF [Gammaproteobacteria bacterium]